MNLDVQFLNKLPGRGLLEIRGTLFIDFFVPLIVPLIVPLCAFCL
jgi:hypothetical protein